MYLALCLAGCQDQVGQVTGSYSYKISGRAAVAGIEQTMENEIGAMELVYATNNTALVTFNALRSAEAAYHHAQDGFDRARQVHDQGGVSEQKR